MKDVKVKISGLITKEGKLLIFRSKGKDVWTCPGGKIEEGETDLECLERELQEEAGIVVKQAEFLQETPVEPAAGNPNKFVVMKFYIVNEYEGEATINPEDNVEEFKWISKADFENRDYEIGSGLVKYAIPELIKSGLMY